LTSGTVTVHSLNQLLERASARRFLEAPPAEDLGLAEDIPFPFLAIVGQAQMKLALLLAVVNPNVGGVLLIGPRGTGKTTAVRSLTDLLPEVERSLCNYGCLPEEISTGGIEAVCPDCARKYAEGRPLTYPDRVRLIELPLNARLEDVIGGIDERAAVHNRLRLQRGILARADHNLLYVDEVNLLNDEIVDAILDAAAQGSYTVRRGPVSATYRSRFVLVGSMNPEEGRLRPQILDRFGLRVLVRGLDSKSSRLEAYRRTAAFRSSPHRIREEYAPSTEGVRAELEEARRTLAEVRLSPAAEASGLELIRRLGIDSLRAEITLFEAARAHALADGRKSAAPQDIRAVAPMAVWLRNSGFMKDYLEDQSGEQAELGRILAELAGKPRGRKAADAPKKPRGRSKVSGSKPKPRRRTKASSSKAKPGRPAGPSRLPAKK
jgi:magnesium chelatase subunit I